MVAAASHFRGQVGASKFERQLNVKATCCLPYSKNSHYFSEADNYSQVLSIQVGKLGLALQQGVRSGYFSQLAIPTPF